MALLFVEIYPHPAFSKKAEKRFELSVGLVRPTELPADEGGPYQIQIRSFSSMCYLRSSFIRKSLGTGSYVDQSARSNNGTELSTQILRL
jgi:hypothetical protein